MRHELQAKVTIWDAACATHTRANTTEVNTQRAGGRSRWSCVVCGDACISNGGCVRRWPSSGLPSSLPCATVQRWHGCSRVRVGQGPESVHVHACPLSLRAPAVITCLRRRQSQFSYCASDLPLPHVFRSGKFHWLFCTEPKCPAPVIARVDLRFAPCPPVALPCACSVVLTRSHV